jgi:hypothetical protein
MQYQCSRKNLARIPQIRYILRTSTLSQRQFPQGAPSTTSHLTLRARHDTQARAARRFVTLCGGSVPSSGAARFFDLSPDRPSAVEALSVGSGDGEIDGEPAFAAESSAAYSSANAASDDIVAACEVDGESKRRIRIGRSRKERDSVYVSRAVGGGRSVLDDTRLERAPMQLAAFGCA